jgi:hypothetical protein
VVEIHVLREKSDSEESERGEAKTLEGRVARVNCGCRYEKEILHQIVEFGTVHFGGLALWEKEEQRSVDWKSFGVGTREKS